MHFEFILNNIIFPFTSGIMLTAILTFFVIKIAYKFKILDTPRDRHQHSKITPLMGGSAIILAFLIMLFVLLFFGFFDFNYINIKKIIGISIAVVILLIGGVLDDKFNLKPYIQILFPIAAVFTVIASGVGVNFITSPFGGVMRIDQIQIHLFTIFGIPAFLNVFADIFTFLWIMATSYTTKLLDGVDGLVSGTSGIGFLILGFLSLGSIVHQKDLAIISFLISGCYFGFLFFNFNPAKIFLGESGSLFSGFMLGALAVMSGGKIAITLLILAIPLLDAFIVIISRIINGKSPFSGDRRHLHYKLKDVGFNDKQVVLILYFITLSFGSIGLISNSFYKLVFLITAIILTITSLVAIAIIRKNKISKLN